MKLSPSVVRESRRIALGVGVMCAVMLLVFLVIGKMTWPVIAGAATGYALAVGNFFVMALNVQKLLDSVTSGDEGAEKTIKAKMRLSYNYRMLFVVAALLVAIFVFNVNWITALMPLLFPQIVIKAYQIVTARRGSSAGPDSGNSTETDKGSEA